MRCGCTEIENKCTLIINRIRTEKKKSIYFFVGDGCYNGTGDYLCVLVQEMRYECTEIKNKCIINIR